MLAQIAKGMFLLIVFVIYVKNIYILIWDLYIRIRLNIIMCIHVDTQNETLYVKFVR